MFRAGLATWLLLSCLGCAQQGAWIYKPGVKLKAPPVKASESRIAVLPLADTRELKNRNALWVALFFVAGPASYTRPEAGGGYISHAAYNARPPEDIAQAVTAELKGVGLFKEAFFTQRENEPNVDFLLRGELTRMQYNGTMITYVPLLGAYLWFLGLPVGTARNEISMRLWAERAGTGEKVWESVVEGKSRRVIGLYYNFAAELEGFPAILKDGLQNSLEKLAEDMRANPAKWASKPLITPAPPTP
jgi:hypothetical protein